MLADLFSRPSWHADSGKCNTGREHDATGGFLPIENKSFWTWIFKDGAGQGRASRKK